MEQITSTSNQGPISGTTPIVAQPGITPLPLSNVSDLSSLNPPQEGCFEWLAQIVSDFFSWILSFFTDATPFTLPPSTSASTTIPPPFIPLLYTNDAIVKIWTDTLAIIQKKTYQSPNGTEHNLEPSLQNAVAHSKQYANAGDIGTSVGPHQTEIVLVNQDCLDLALSLQKDGYNPAVLNMANAETAGGGTKRGAQSQEETCCRRSTLLAVLDSDLGFQTKQFYPFSLSGGVYSPDVTVFRSNHATGYTYLDAPYTVAFLSSAAIYSPALVKIEGQIEPRLTDIAAKATLEKMRTQLKMASDHGHDAVVLSAFGCGAFCNPPKHIAELYMQLLEGEFKGCFKRAAFSIIEDQNTGKMHNPEGNFKPFKDVILQHGGRVDSPTN